MNKKLPIEKEKGFLNKIKNFFKKIFFKNNKKTLQVESNLENILEENKFHQNIKIEVDNTDIKKDLDREELFEKIRKEPNSLQHLSNEQLEKLSKYYEQKIEKNDEIIKEKQEKLKKLEEAS